MLHELIDWQVGDLVERATARLAEWHVGERRGGATGPQPVIAAGTELAEQKGELERFLYTPWSIDIPTSCGWRVGGPAVSAERCLPDTQERPELMPASFSRASASGGSERLCVGDYLAGMTDRYAQQEYRKWFANGPN